MTSPQVRLRALRRRDLGLLSQWLRALHVQRWWPEDADPVAIERRYGAAVDGADPTELFVVELDGEPVGFVQRYRLEDNPDWQRSLAPTGSPLEGAGIDYLIGTEVLTGHGLGPVLIDHVVEDTWDRFPQIGAVVVGVQEDNRASWRALEKAGFHRVWTGALDSDDPSDTGTTAVYVRRRTPPSG